MYEDLIRPSNLYPDKNEFEEYLSGFTKEELIEMRTRFEEMEEYDYCIIVQKEIDARS